MEVRAFFPNVYYQSVLKSLLATVSVPDFIDSNGNTIECGRAVLSPQCNAAGWIDRILMGSHMYEANE